MGNESSSTLKNLDKRTARREYQESFVEAIEKYRKNYTQNKAQEEETAANSLSEAFKNWNDNSIRVFARKRPIFQHELDNGEYDVITACGKNIVIHDARMHTDMKRQYINHHEFQFDYVFNESSTNQFVYETAAKPLVEIACEGGCSTAFMYGQTGSGKTFTMSYIYTEAAEEIFRRVAQSTDGRYTVSVSFIEIAGDNVHDLLNAFAPTQLRSAADGSVHAYPVVEPQVSSKEELLALIQHGLNIRSKAATGVHDQSSRSHALLKIYIQKEELLKAPSIEENENTEKAESAAEDLERVNSEVIGEMKDDVDKEESKLETSLSPGTIEGSLTLVDLAGSEHRIDSMYHGKERRKETSYINASLMALKECIRARATGTAHLHQHVYRKSKLTMALKNSFHLPSARTIVIATVSPASKDTEHSLNTLRHACIMQGQDNSAVSKGDAPPSETRFVTGGKVTTEEIGELNIAKLARKNFEKKKAGAGNALKSSNGNALTTAAAKEANESAAAAAAAAALKEETMMTDAMKKKLQEQSETLSFQQLPNNVQELLMGARQRLGREERQFARIQQFGPEILVDVKGPDEEGSPISKEKAVTTSAASIAKVATSPRAAAGVLSKRKSFSSLPSSSVAAAPSVPATTASTLADPVEFFPKMREAIYLQELKETVSEEILQKLVKSVLMTLNYPEDLIDSYLHDPSGFVKSSQLSSGMKSLKTAKSSPEMLFHSPASKGTIAAASPADQQKKLTRRASSSAIPTSPAPLALNSSTTTKSHIPPPTVYEDKQQAIIQYRIEMEKLKIEEMAKAIESQKTHQSTVLTSGHAGAAIQQEIQEENSELAYHLREVQRLNSILEKDLLATNRKDPYSTDKLTMTQKFGVKKQLANHKAAILRIQKKR